MSDRDRVARGLEAQLRALAERRASGAELIGWKIGLNDPRVQEGLGLAKPVIGTLTTASLVQPGATHSLAGGKRVAVEPEVAIRLGKGAAIESLAAAIEIVDLDPELTDLESILARNVFHRGVVLGAPVESFEPDRLGDVTAAVRRNGEVEQRAAFTDAGLGPDEVVRIVAERLELVGRRLQPGEVIIGGSLTPMVFVEPSDEVEIDLGPLGKLALRVS